MSASCVYQGRVRHRRFAPIEHAFAYRVFLMYLDLGELDRVFAGRWLWSVNRRNVAAFHRSDHLGRREQPLDAAVRDLVEQRLGRRPHGAIRLLTHLRYLGYCMNPVSFYYCFAPGEQELDAIVAEVSNTPWGERHCYVLDARDRGGNSRRLRFQFAKEFHVSPFMAMQQEYHWRFTVPGRRLAIHMVNQERGAAMLDATLVLERAPLTSGTLARTLLTHPAMTWKVIGAIYWQALRLWWKRCPVHAHPKHRLAPRAGNGGP